MCEFPNSKLKLQFYIPARERLTAIRVMTQLFQELVGRFHNAVNDVVANEKNDIRELWDVRQTQAFIDELSSYFGHGTPEEVTLTLSQETKDAMNAGFKAPIVGLLGRFQQSQTDGSSTQIKLRRPSPLDLAECCGLMIETLLQDKRIHHAFVLFDDVDLLEAYTDADRNGRYERSILADAIDRLHQTPGIDVLMTARSWYANANKEFNELVDLHARLR